ncbi:MAG: hypothetical protein CNLJKLNK_00865 [Holosporales bacterium]
MKRWREAPAVHPVIFSAQTKDNGYGHIYHLMNRFLRGILCI